MPYGTNWTNLNVMMQVENGYRLPAPKLCPKAIYIIMIDCWFDSQCFTLNSVRRNVAGTRIVGAALPSRSCEKNWSWRLTCSSPPVQKLKFAVAFIMYRCHRWYADRV